MIKGIIYDLDGVLIDAVDWHFKALNRSLSLFGHALNREEHEQTYNGLPTQRKLAMLSESKGLPAKLHPFIVEMKQRYTTETIQTECKPSASITSMLTALKEQGIKIAVASNSARQTVDLVLERMEIRSYFDVVLSREEVKRPKPCPDIFFRALELLNLKSSEVLIIEDSKPGVEAATQTTPNVLVVNSASEVTLEAITAKLAQISAKSASHSKNDQSTHIPVSKPRPVIQVVIPMAGLGTRFQAAGFIHPKPFIDVLGKPMIQWVKENVKPNNWESTFSFLCNETHLKQAPYRRTLEALAPGSHFISVAQTTEGAACTVLLAIDKLNPTQPLLLANSDQWVEASIDHFLEDAISSDCDGSILSFQANDKKWSYAKLNRNKRVVEVAEKIPISNQATVGIYYFKRAQDFIDAAYSMIRNNTRTNGEFYVCPVYNELIRKKKYIKIFEIEASHMHGLGTPEDLKAFTTWHQREVPSPSNRTEPLIPQLSPK